jgi:hypothetical protein
VRTAARLRDVDATPSDHRGTGEPEQYRGANSIADQHGVAVAGGDSHADERARDPDASRARSVLRGGRRAHAGP